MRKVCCVVFASLLGIASATAQTYPSRYVTLVVPLATGGSTDTIGRIIAEGLRTPLGQPVIVENTPGASRARRPTATPSRSANGAPMSRAAPFTTCRSIF